MVCALAIHAVPALAATRATVKKPTTTTLKTSGTFFVKKESGKLIVTVKPKTASGVAEVFYQKEPGGSAKSFGTITIAGGSGSGTREAAEAGTFKLWVVYEGSKTFAPSKSNSVTVVVQQ
jgi:hypothetical protein